MLVTYVQYTYHLCNKIKQRKKKYGLFGNKWTKNKY